MKREHEDLTRYRDGEDGRSILSDALTNEDAEFRRLLQTADRGRVVLPPLRDTVMARIRTTADPLWRRAWAWVSCPRVVRIRPLSAAVAFAAAVATILVAWPEGTSDSERPATMTAQTSASTQLVFVAPEAAAVAVTGDFVNWSPEGVPLRAPRKDGVWIVELELPPGRYQYVFIVDGEWRADPNAASQVDDSFGQHNSVLLVPDRRAS